MYYITYKIEALEALKAERMEGGMSYISGSTIRGAFISKYIRDKKISLNECPELKKKLLKDIYFWNGYPSIEDKRTIPAPFCFLADKHKLTSYDGSAIDIVSSFQKTPVGYKVCKKEPFILWNENEINGLGVKKEFKLHVSVNGRDSEKERDMFRYEAISKGQGFLTVVQVKDEKLAKELQQLMKEAIIYLGGSKGSGYGKCKISYVETKEQNPEETHVWSRPKGNKIFVYYLSDAVLYKEDGNVSDSIDLNYLQQVLDVEQVSYIGGAVDTVSVSGYNHTWHATLPQIEGIRAGSIQCYEVSQMPTIEKLQLLEEKGVGIRKTDGYGRIMIIQEPAQSQWKRIKVEEKLDITQNLSDEERDEVEKLVTSLYENRVMQKIDEKVVTTAQKVKLANMTNNQIGILQQKATEYLYQDANKAKQNMKEYFEHLNTRKTNRKTNYQLEDAKVGANSIQKYLLDFMENCENVEAFIKEEEFVRLPIMEQYQIKPSKEKVYQYNMIFLEKMLRYLLRQR